MPVTEKEKQPYIWSSTGFGRCEFCLKVWLAYLLSGKEDRNGERILHWTSAACPQRPRGRHPCNVGNAFRMLSPVIAPLKGYSGKTWASSDPVHCVEQGNLVETGSNVDVCNSKWAFPLCPCPFASLAAWSRIFAVALTMLVMLYVFKPSEETIKYIRRCYFL